jgi:sporulation protein YlmC with PRC-barrel domain
MPTGRVIHAGLGLLDRQLVDRDGRLCGKVDDIELTEPDELGNVHLAAILCGPGALLTRTGHRRLGRWLRRHAGAVSPTAAEDPTRIPFHLVADIGSHVTLAMDSEDVATFGAERWTRDHIIRHIPGSDYEPPE